MNSSENQTNSESNVSTFYWFVAVFVCPASLALNCITLYTIFKFKNDFKSSYFKLVIGLGYTDLVALLYVIHSFLCCLLEDNYMGITIDKILAYAYGSIGWYTGLNINLIICINRFIAIAFFTKYTKIFTNRLTNVLVVLAYALGLGIGILYQVVGTNIFMVDFKSPGFVEENEDIDKVLTMDLVYGTTVGIFVILTHAITALLCIVRKTGFKGTKSQYKRERKMLIQGTIIGSMLIINAIIYFFPVGEMSWVIGVLLVSAFNPLVYMSTDGNLRKRVFETLFFKKASIIPTASGRISTHRSSVMMTTVG